ncbi:sensor histidine kinase [Ferruginibacter sp.]
MHYDTKEGLAGSTVYSLCQDRDGFMWFATDNGLSRFDGTHFKNFTVKDGLPDNEVLIVNADSKGRVWIGAFSREICYYFNGKFHNKDNDSLVKKLWSGRNIDGIVEDDDNFIAFNFRNVIKIVTPDNRVLLFDPKKIDSAAEENLTAIYTANKKIMCSAGNGQYQFMSSTLGWKKKFALPQKEGVYQNTYERGIMDSYAAGYDSVKQITIRKYFPGRFIHADDKNGVVEFVNSTNGCWLIDDSTHEIKSHFLPGKKISHARRDSEKNIWFASLGEGVFKLPSEIVKTVSFAAQTKSNSNEVFSITGYRKGIIAGGDYGKALVIDDTDFKMHELEYPKDQLKKDKDAQTNRLYSMCSLSDSAALLGFDLFMMKLDNDLPSIVPIYTIKSIEKIDDDHAIVGTSFYAFVVRIKDMQITDTLWRERCTKVFYQNNKYYIGTLHGLYEIGENKKVNYLGDLHHALTRRITGIKNSGDSVLWIGTSDNGIVAFKDGKVVAVITDSSGLSSNICKTLFIKGKNLWIGTDKGINKIDITDNTYEIIKYSTSDGLPSNVINALYVKDSTIWIGTPAGLTYFKENSLSNSSMCNLKMLGVYVSGRQLAMDSVYQLSYKDNNINFQYAGISLRSGGEITYYYKLTGLNDNWQTTTQDNIDYKSLPPNDYVLELYAVNKYGVKSKTITIRFVVETPFWKTAWFYILLSVITIGGTIMIFNRRNKITRQRLEEKNRFQKQFAQLEQQALQTQMNPHFIFNCLNSIQQYILINEKEKANEYLTGFAALIRQTLDISAQKAISVSEEASYLKKYLDMERMRFGDSFEYNITIDPAVNADQTELPALLLQPYVENCLRHGIRYKKEGTGKVDILFSVKGTCLYCAIRDNGIGREKAAEYKSKQHIEYQSKGMSLTSKRIELLNTVNDNKINVAVTDMLNDDGSAAGTLVEINIPI